MFRENRSDLAATLLRCTIGLLFLAHGLYLKVFVFGVSGTVGYFESVGFPGALAYLVIAGETLGGLALIAGLYTRWVSLALVPVLLGAASVHWGNGWLFNVPGGGWEYPVFWMVALLVLALLGDGRFALGSLRAIPGSRPEATSAR